MLKYTVCFSLNFVQGKNILSFILMEVLAIVKLTFAFIS